MAGRRTTAVVSGGFVAFTGLLLVWAGLTSLSQHRDADGYLLSDPLMVDRLSHAVITHDIGLLRGHYECAGEESFFLAFYSPDDVRMQGVASDSDALFMGIAPADALEAYLGRVAHDEITEWDCDVHHIEAVEYTRHEGVAAPGPPGIEQLWVTSTSGTGQQTLDWTIESGEWAAVIMNADASSGVSADLRFGALAPSGLATLAWTSSAVGLVALIGGGLLLYLGLRRRSKDSTQPPPGSKNGESAPPSEAPMARMGPRS